jgi:hypothetical protein
MQAYIKVGYNAQHNARRGLKYLAHNPPGSSTNVDVDYALQSSLGRQWFGLANNRVFVAAAIPAN